MADGTYPRPGGNITLLWTNSSASSSFPAQTVPVGGDCDAVIVVAKTAAGGNDHISVFVAKGCNTYIEGFWTYKYARTVKLTSSGVEFGTGNGGEFTSAMTSNNAYIVPLYIYGVKL